MRMVHYSKGTNNIVSTFRGGSEEVIMDFVMREVQRKAKKAAKASAKL